LLFEENLIFIFVSEGKTKGLIDKVYGEKGVIKIDSNSG
jgi:hypothetical protein